MANEFDQGLIDTAPDFQTVFGETVTYKPRGGGTRSISAVVNREQPAGLDGAPHGHAPVVTIEVINDSTTGISSDEVDCGGDNVNLAVRIGDTPQDRPIVNAISMDAGMMRLELR